MPSESPDRVRAGFPPNHIHPEAPRRSSDFDVLVGRWCEALDAAQAVLRGAGHHLGGQELAEHSPRLAQERSDVVRLLRRLGNDWKTDSPLLDGLLDQVA